MPTVGCIEVGGSGAQTIRFAPEQPPTIDDGVVTAGVDAVAVAVPGIVSGNRVVAASNLGWFDVDAGDALGLAVPPVLVLNDAEAAALGESLLRHGANLTFVGLGTGVGGAVAIQGRVIADNLFGHSPGHSDLLCRCGRTGCLETVAAGWALADEPTGDDLERAAEAIADAIDAEPEATPLLVVVGGGLARSHPALVDAIARRLPHRSVEPSAAPAGAKSAAAWGLLHTAHRDGLVTP